MTSSAAGTSRRDASTEPQHVPLLQPRAPGRSSASGAARCGRTARHSAHLDRCELAPWRVRVAGSAPTRVCEFARWDVVARHLVLGRTVRSSFCQGRSGRISPPGPATARSSYRIRTWSGPSSPSSHKALRLPQRSSGHDCLLCRTRRATAGELCRDPVVTMRPAPRRWQNLPWSEHTPALGAAALLHPTRKVTGLPDPRLTGHLQ
jgi:hypothetical protein